jgi:membrane peptidoglycan carboxypeptidase
MLPDVLIGVEDKDFEHHGGVAPKSVLGAAFAMLRGGKMRGAGTLSEQLARTLIWPGEDPGTQKLGRKIWRKVNEFFLASVLEQKLSKPEIVLDYVNSVDLGSIETRSGCRHALKGFKAAAHYFFGVDDLRKLTLAQAAALVAVLPGPNRYLNDPAAMRSRRDSVVLDDYAKLHPERANAVRAAKEEPLGLIKPEDDDDGNAAYGFFLDAWRSSPTFKHDLSGDDLTRSDDRQGARFGWRRSIPRAGPGAHGLSHRKYRQAFLWGLGAGRRLHLRRAHYATHFVESV